MMGVERQIRSERNSLLAMPGTARSANLHQLSKSPGWLLLTYPQF
ncbi:hypothetical protein HMPREF3150_01189 [Pseudomonas aeruginosa]|nr:hypothetical protein HMPREF3150_01189 [Pseudomonas aeruginosa]